jgi:hypothetical protein
MNLLSFRINGTTINNPGGIPTGGIFETFNIIEVFIALLIIAGVVLSLIYLVLGGISWITSEGDKQKMAQARSKVTYAILGLLVVLLSYFIISFVYYYFRISGASSGGGRRADIKTNNVLNLASNWVLTNKK